MTTQSHAFFTNHILLKTVVIGLWAVVFVMAWLSFWLLSAEPISLTAFLLDVTQPDNPSFWQFSRIAGVLAYMAMWLSMMTGLSIGSQTSQYWFERGKVLSWHEFFTWLAIGMVVIHAGVLLKDGYIAPTLSDVLVPFGWQSAKLSAWAWLWIGLGQVAVYVMALVALMAKHKHKLVKSLWKYLHALVLLAYVSSVVHGLFIGTDSEQLWLKFLFVATNGVLALMVFFRIGQMRYQVKSS